MASPNNTIFRKTLDYKDIEKADQVHPSDDIRSPFEVLKKWARHPVLHQYHKKRKIPYILFGNQTILIEYSLDPAKGSAPRRWFRIWEPLFTGNGNKGHKELTYFSSEDDYNRKSTLKQQDFLNEMINGYLKKGEADIYPTSHGVRINNVRSFETSSQYLFFKVNKELKKRSQIAREVFELIVLSNEESLPEIKKKSSSVLRNMIRKDKKERW